MRATLIGLESNPWSKGSLLFTLFPAFLLLFLPFYQAQGQWPTSTETDSALLINYGYSGRMITFDDGSSIISHGLDNTVFLQKFDPAGYRVWPGIVVAHDNDSSDTFGGSRIVSDGAGGAVLLWEDHRGAFFDSISAQYSNEAFYMQRVDREGNVVWQEDGVLVVPPDSGSKRSQALVSDGSGGGIVVAVEAGFSYPGAPHRERMFAARVGVNGTRLWDVTLDTSSRGGDLNILEVDRAGRLVYIDYGDARYPFGEGFFTLIMDTSGVVSSPPWVGSFTNTSWRDSILFTRTTREGVSELRKLGAHGDTVWTSEFTLPDSGCQGTLPFRFIALVPDDLGGVFYMYSCNDTIYHIHNDGSLSRPVFPQLEEIGDYISYSGDGGLVIANSEGIAQRWDSLGVPIWGSVPIVWQSDPENAYFEDFWGDNNGGIISTFWAISSSLSAQHTGRYGVPGVITTSVPDGQGIMPLAASLQQNYPNPFNAVTSIQYSISSRSQAKLTIVDILGREIAVLVDEQKEAGVHFAIWDATSVASGAYFSCLEVGRVSSKSKKLILLR